MKSISKSRPLLSEKETFDKIQKIGQAHLLSHWKTLSDVQQENLRRQITNLDLELFRRQQVEVQKPEEKLTGFAPFKAYFPSGNRHDYERGRALVKEGKVAVVVLAGGQGSRLRCKGPKGCVQITAVKHKTLFQFLAEKIKAATAQAGVPLEVAVMTSPLNHVETQTYFVQNAFFGLNPSYLTCFYQRMWPFLDFEGNLFLESPDHMAQGPNGNGGLFRRLVELGIWEKWKKRGIEMVNVIPVDNPLASPFDFELFGFHHRQKNDVTVKASWRSDPHEKVGVLAKREGKPTIVEYSELSEEDKEAKDEEGKLKYGIANLGLYCYSMPFIQAVSEKEIPLHKAAKAVKRIEIEELPSEPNAWKFEEFIFDVLPFAQQVQALLFPRTTCFAPLKNLEGEDSIATVQASLLTFDRKVFAGVTGNEPPEEAIFELSPKFYYPTAEFLEKWKGAPFPQKDYIDE